MSFLNRKGKPPSSEGQRAVEFFNEIRKRFGNDSNLFKLRQSTEKEQDQEVTDDMRAFLEKQTCRTLTDDMLNAFTILEEKLRGDVKDLEVDNKLLEEKLLQVSYENESRSKILESLKNANERLIRENAIFFNDSLKHRYLKLKTNELTATRNQLMGMLEIKRQKALDLHSQLDKLLEEHQNLTKEREKAGMNAAHLCSKLKDLHSRCKELDLIKEEQMHRRLLVSRFRQRDGPIQVYLVTRSTFSTSCMSFLSLQRVAIQGHSSTKKRKKPAVFQFYRVFKPTDEIQYLYEDLRLHAISALDGFNTAFVTYGQTGTGKTRTMFGTQSQSGLMHYVMTEVLSESLVRKTWTFTITCSALEAHGSGAFDILSKDSQPVPMIDDGLKLSMGCSIAEVDLTEQEDVVTAVEKIKDCRSTGNSSRVQEDSTRRHLVVVVRVRGCDRANKSETIDGTILLVDLAGFEDVNQLVNLPRDLVNEAFVCNRSLNTLGEVLTAVRKKKANVPFHRAPLTMLLKPCLMGEAHLCILLHSYTQIEEHHSILKTMRFGMNAIPKNKGNRGRRVMWKV